MSTNTLPKTIDPVRLAKDRAHFIGFLQQADMPRLVETLGHPQGPVRVDLEFDTDAQGLKVVHGHIYAEIQLQCQRCLRPFAYNIESEFSLSPVQNDTEAKQLPEVYDPLMFEGEPLELLDIIEEDILLNLPVIAMHEPEECSAALPKFYGKNEDIPEKENPFSQLKSIKKDKH